MFTIEQNWRDTKPLLGSQINYGHPLAQGLVGAWLMNEGGGNKINDIARNNTGTFVNSTQWSPSIKGISTKFSVSSKDHINVPTSPSLNPSSNNLTIIVGALATSDPTNLANNYRTLVKKDGFYILRNSNGPDAGIGPITICPLWFDGTNLKRATSATYPSLNTFYQYAWTVKNNVIDSLWLNNKKLSITVVTWFATARVTTNPLTISEPGTTSAWDGNIFYAYIYNRVLSPSEIQSLYIDPYQFIQPLRRRFFSIPASGTTSAPIETSLISSRHLQVLGVG